MHKTEELKELLEEELYHLGKKEELSPMELECAYKASKTLYYLEVTGAMKEYGDKEEDEYSERGMSHGFHRGTYRGSYDMMPRYHYNSYDMIPHHHYEPYDMESYRSRNSYDNSYRSNNSYENRNDYSRVDERETMIAKLEQMMREAPNATEKDTIQHCINKLMKE